ncbi:MAG TPA: D-cysteine desulfhydrase family protein [Tissierellia bacterium]|nr:D-cysteine desulfhydrase family protein [Tissierellia bacterium]
MKPERLVLANLPTRIEPLRCPDLKYLLYLKRDDQTGSEFAGNKIRKLEYAVKEALDQGCNTLITCGGIQSNHARATAAVAAKLGLSCHLFLRTDQRLHPQGNYLLDELLGATIHFISADDYRNHRQEKMEQLQAELTNGNNKAYIIPEGASNAIGTFGYYNALEEIVAQEKQLGITFDTIVCAVGSGGTYAGLVFANSHHQFGKTIIGVNICDSAEHFKQVTMGLRDGFTEYLGETFPLNDEELHLIDGNVGRGYALNTPDEMDFIRDFARKTGVIFDPVYTGKAMRGLYQAIQTDHPLIRKSKNILFIHTGGLYGLFPKAEEFKF